MGMGSSCLYSDANFPFLLSDDLQAHCLLCVQGNIQFFDVYTIDGIWSIPEITIPIPTILS